MWMLHEVWLINTIEGSVYVNVTWSLVDKYYWRKCLCERYMKLIDEKLKSLSKANVYVNVAWSLIDKYYEGSVYVNVTWSLIAFE
jgi:hypothetical protein